MVPTLNLTKVYKKKKEEKIVLRLFCHPANGTNTF